MTRRALIALATVALLAPASTASAQGGDFEYQVVGGYQVDIAEFPWQAAVAFAQERKPGQDAFHRQFCGGTLVTSRIVLTAAHCVHSTDPECNSIASCLTDDTGDKTRLLDPDDVKVILGQTTLSTTPPQAELEVLDVAYQGDGGESPAFGPSTLRNDVGYLVLAEATGQAQIKIATEEALWVPGTFVDVTGWGTTSFGGPKSNTLRAGSVPMVSDPDCAAAYNASFDEVSMVCAGYPEGGVDACQGDSGGPLQSPLAGGGYRLVGLTSWGRECALAGFPGVYARVAGDQLRVAIEDKVDALESEHEIDDESVLGVGGEPRGGGPTFPKQDQPAGTPPQQPSGTTTSTTTTSTTTQPKKDPFAKCRKIRKKTKKQKKKRRACMTKVKKRLREAG